MLSDPWCVDDCQKGVSFNAPVVLLFSGKRGRFFKEVQPPNTLLPIVVTVSGIVTVSKLAQSKNAWSSIVVNPSEIYTVFKELQSRKASNLILFTLLGIFTDFKTSLSRNAPLPIAVIPSKTPFPL